MKKIVIIIFVFFAFSCQKTEQEIVTEDFVNPMEYVGIMHNEDAKYILENMQEIPKKHLIKSEIKRILQQKYSEKNQLKSVSTGLNTIPDFPDTIDELDINKWIDSYPISDELKTKMKETLIILSSGHNLSDLLDIIREKELDAKIYFNEKELEVYYSHLAVAKYSAIFWSPESEGGLYGIQYLKTDNLKSVQKVNWWKVLGVDCVSGIVGTAAATPFGGAIAYVGGSTIAVIMQL